MYWEILLQTTGWEAFDHNCLGRLISLWNIAIDINQLWLYKVDARKECVSRQTQQKGLHSQDDNDCSQGCKSEQSAEQFINSPVWPFALQPANKTSPWFIRCIVPRSRSMNRHVWVLCILLVGNRVVRLRRRRKRILMRLVAHGYTSRGSGSVIKWHGKCASPRFTKGIEP